MRWSGGSRLAAVALAITALATAASADARVKREGAWPDADKPVTLDVDELPRRDALRKLADVAGWSLVVHAPPGDEVDLHVKGQPASKVLEILLDDADYVVRRDGTLVSIELAAPRGASSGAHGSPGPATPAAAPVPPASPVPPVPPVPGVASAPPAPPAPATPSASGAPGWKDLKIQLGKTSEIDEPHKRGSDRTVMGGSVTIAKGQTARDVTVFGGNLDIEGEVTGDVTVFGGKARVHPDAHVRGDATVFGGMLQLDAKSRVDGDVSAVGGHVERSPEAVVGGDVSVKGDDPDEEDETDSPPHSANGGPPATEPSHHAPRSWMHHATEDVLDGVRFGAVLFVIGTLLIALAGRRMDALRGEIAARPMRSIAVGLLGTFVSIVLLIALCVTVIGAPIALVVGIVGVFAVLGAMCAVLSVIGEGLLRHKTENPYVHLAVGCAIFVALSVIPWVGPFVCLALVLAGVGVLFGTRGAGYFVRKNGGSTPYRSPEVA